MLHSIPPVQDSRHHEHHHAEARLELRIHWHILSDVWFGNTRIHVKTRVTVEMAIFVEPQLAARKVGNAAVFQYVMFTVSVTWFVGLRLNVGCGCEQNAEEHTGEE